MPIVSDCPWCFVNTVSFAVIHEDPAEQGDGTYNIPSKERRMIGKCPHCHEIVMFIMRADVVTFSATTKYVSASFPNDVVHIAATFPARPQPLVPEHLPEPVAKKMHEAERSYLAGHWAAAAGGYRAGMERALKNLFPDDKGMLHARVRRAEEEKRFPQAMVDWLDEVKTFGNDAMHDYDADPTKEDAEAARDFANLFLTYAYTMPKRVELAREKRRAAKEDPGS